MSLLQDVDSHSESDLDRLYVGLIPCGRSSLVLAGVLSSALCGTLCLGIGIWQLLHPSPHVSPKPPAVSTTTTTTTTSTSWLPWNLPKFVDFEATNLAVPFLRFDGSELGGSMEFAAQHTTTDSWYGAAYFSVEVPEESISVYNESKSVSLPRKGVGLSGLTSFYRVSTRASGYTFNTPSVVRKGTITYPSGYGDINLMVGEIRSMRRKNITDLSALKLPKEQKELLQKSPRDFVDSYGRYFISEMIYGVGYLAQCIIPKNADHSVVDLQDVFSERDPFMCKTYTIAFDGVDASILKTFPMQSEVEEHYKMWKRQVDLGNVSEAKMRRLRIAVRPFADIPEVAEILQRLPAAQRAPLEVPRITSTTATLLVDDEAKVTYVISALGALPPTCEKGKLQVAANNYLSRFATLDLPARQVEFEQANFSWLEGGALLTSLVALQKKCSP
eukprot:TRINITY_DN23988_c0_g3_i1.p1 TRINITY_DN23988_c0_g3~~TRINITY_DN23988_c0_g3_i1.p1  ORF type:complete len:445 (-),score=45.91 TRINITY_DN23988_c0_g3_i1:152-1486(-)